MGDILNLNERQWTLTKFWLPALANGAIAWLLLLLLGDTPLIRATGLALVIVGVTLALRRMGSAIAMIGGLVLVLSPAFWSQTGGGEGSPATIVIALFAASVGAVILTALSRRPAVALGFGIVIFVGFFMSQIGTPRSIRLTSFVIGWLIFLLVDMLLLTNPRPDEESAPLILQGSGKKNPDGSESAQNYHTFGILLLVTVGIINDPLLALLAPAIILSLYLTHTKLPIWYWIVISLVFGMGLQGIRTVYLEEQATKMALFAWRDGTRWLDLIKLMVRQFSVFGIILAILGVARLSRWYPPLGTVSLLAFGAYWFFALIYLGGDRDVRVLPLYVIFVLWMSYAVLAISEWSSRTFKQIPHVGRYIPIFLYGLLPVMLLWQIIQS